MGYVQFGFARSRDSLGELSGRQVGMDGSCPGPVTDWVRQERSVQETGWLEARKRTTQPHSSVGRTAARRCPAQTLSPCEAAPFRESPLQAGPAWFSFIFPSPRQGPLNHQILQAGWPQMCSPPASASPAPGCRCHHCARLPFRSCPSLGGKHIARGGVRWVTEPPRLHQLLGTFNRYYLSHQQPNCRLSFCLPFYPVCDVPFAPCYTP